MKIQLKPIALALCIAGLTVTPLTSLSASRDDLKTQAIERQLAALQDEVRALKNQLNTSNKQVKYQPNETTTRRALYKNRPAHARETIESETVNVSNPTPPKLSRNELIKLIEEQKEYLPFDLDAPGQAFVSTGPYVDVPLQFAGSNLIVNSPSVNTDVRLLGVRKHIIEQLRAMGGELFKEPYHSHLLLSGDLQTQAGYFSPASGTTGTDIELTNAVLDAFFVGPSTWTLGLIEFMYDNSTPANSVFTSPSSYRVSNSRVFINKAFVTIGDFSQSPLYGTFGQFNVPYGLYASFMVSDTFTKLLGRTKARSILLGYQPQDKNTLYAAAFIFRGDSHADNHASRVSHVNNGGVNLGYIFNQGIFSGNVGGGVIANLADSEGMQKLVGFSTYEVLTHRVPGYNARGILSIGEHLDFIAEFIGAGKRFNPNDMSFNGVGARPWAVDTEASYSFKMFDKPTSIGISYQKSHRSLALGIPKDRYAIAMNTSIWRNTLQALEVRHDVNYPAGNSANGPLGAIPITGACVANNCTQSGGSDNAVIAQFDYFF